MEEHLKKSSNQINKQTKIKQVIKPFMTKKKKAEVKGLMPHRFPRTSNCTKTNIIRKQKEKQTELTIN